MPRCLIKLTRGDKYAYLDWSTVVDAPITYGMSIGELIEYYRVEYGENALKHEFPARLARTNTTGTSALDQTLGEILMGNRAGENEAELTEDEIWTKFVIEPAKDS